MSNDVVGRQNWPTCMLCGETLPTNMAAQQHKCSKPPSVTLSREEAEEDLEGLRYAACLPSAWHGLSPRQRQRKLSAAIKSLEEKLG